LRGKEESGISVRGYCKQRGIAMAEHLFVFSNRKGDQVIAAN
jgi:hypothetical protein